MKSITPGVIKCNYKLANIKFLNERAMSANVKNDLWKIPVWVNEYKHDSYLFINTKVADAMYMSNYKYDSCLKINPFLGFSVTHT